MQRGPKTKPPRPTYSIFRSDFHLPAIMMDSADNLVVVFDLVSVQQFSTTLFKVPFTLPTPQGRRDSHLRTVPTREIRMLRKATQDMEDTSANQLRKECHGC